MCAGFGDEIVDSHGGHHDAVRAKRDPVVARVQLVALEVDGSGLCRGGGLMQSNATLQAGGCDLCGERLKIFEIGLDCDNTALFADPTSEFKRKKPNIRSDINDRGPRRDKILQPIYRSRLDPGFVDRVSREEHATRPCLPHDAGSSEHTIRSHSGVLQNRFQVGNRYFRRWHQSQSSNLLQCSENAKPKKLLHRAWQSILESDKGARELRWYKAPGLETAAQREGKKAKPVNLPNR